MLFKLLPVVLTLLVGLTPARAAEGDRDAAERKGDAALASLRDGDCARSLARAEEALRLDPTFSAALLMKADAYECAGDLAQATVLRSAALETGDAPVVSRAAAEIARVDAGAPTRRWIEARTPEGAAAPPLLSLSGDPEPLRARFQQAVDAGRCSLAQATAEELRRLDPEGTEGWALLGDAMRCSGRTRDAVLMYRSYAAAGGDDPALLESMEQLASNLGVLEVRVLGASEQAPSRVRLFVGDDVAEPSSHEAASATFADLPAGVRLRLEVDAKMLQPVKTQVYALRPGELRVLDVTPLYAGFGTLKSAPYDPGSITVVATTAGERVEPPPGAEVQVTAGPVTLIVEEGGRRTRVERKVEVDTTLFIDPARYRPSTLTLSNAPAGAFVRVTVTADDGTVFERGAELPPQVGPIDPTTGLRIAAPVRFDDLIGGQASVSVEHPKLGAWVGEAALEPGGEAALAVEVAKIPGVSHVTVGWRSWKSRYDDVQLQRRGDPIPPIVGAIALMGGGAALAVASYMQTEARAKLALQCAVLDSPAYEDADFSVRNDTCVGQIQAEGLQTGLAVGAGVSVGLGVGFIGFSIALGQGERPEPLNDDEWDPWGPGGASWSGARPSGGAR